MDNLKNTNQEEKFKSQEDGVAVNNENSEPKSQEDGVMVNKENQEQEIERSIEAVEMKLKQVENSLIEVGGEQGLNETLKKMTPEEISATKKKIGEKMAKSKEYMIMAAMAVIGVTCVYFGNNDLKDFGGNGDLLDGATFAAVIGGAVGGTTAFIASAKKWTETIKDRIKIRKNDKKEN